MNNKPDRKCGVYLLKVLIAVLMFAIMVSLALGAKRAEASPSQPWRTPLSPPSVQPDEPPPTIAAAKVETKPASAQHLQGAGVDQEGGAIPIGHTFFGSINDNTDADAFQFQGVAGESVRIEVGATSGYLDPMVTLFFDTSRFYPGQTTIASSHVEGASQVTAESFASSLPQQASVFVDITTPLDGAIIPIPVDPTNIIVTGNAGVTGAGVPTNLEVAIVIDVSGSIDSSEYDLEVAGVRAILDALDPDQDGVLSCSVALVQFDTDAIITSSLTRSRAQVEAGLVRKGDGYTNYNAAFEKAPDALAPSSATDSVSELVLFFSDGNPTAGYTPPGGGGPLDEFQPKGIRVDTFGIGSYLDEAILRAIAQTTGGTYTSIPTFADIARVTASLPGVVGLQSVVIDINGDGAGEEL